MSTPPLNRRRALALLLAGCGASVLPLMPAIAQPSPASAALTRIFHESDEELLRLNPQTATVRGDLRYADQFGDLITDDYMRAFHAYIRRDIARIGEVDRAALSPAERIQLDVFDYNTRFALRSYDSGVAQALAQDFALDHLNGQQVGFPQFLAVGGGFPYNNVADYRNALSLHRGYATFLGRAIEAMRRGIARGNVHIRIVTERMIGQMREAIAAGVDGSPFYTPIASFPAAIEASDRERLTAAFRASIADVIMPAHRALLAFLETDYLPASRTGTPGLSALPNGQALYAYYLELFTTTSLGADEIHRTGLAEVSRIRAEMEQTKRRVGFTGSLPDFFTHIRTDPRFKPATADALIGRYRAVWQRVRPLLPRYFSTLARLPFEIRPVPPEIEATAPGAYYIGGTPDGTRPGVFYVNTHDLPTRTSPIATALFLHEAQPGHHFQSALAQQDESLPAFLRFLWNSGFSEGWGLYCERLGVEMGVYDDPYQYFGMLDMQMFRATRLVIDTGLHALGWSRQQAIDYMTANTSLPPNVIELEVDRYIVTPGQATSYKVGEQVILRLRREAERARRFDLRAFHNQVLNTGSIPLNVLEAKLGAWTRSLA